MYEIEVMEWLITALWIFYIIFLLVPLMILDIYTDYKINKLQRERKAYNLKSEYLEIELTQEDVMKLYEVMRYKGYTSKDKYIRDKLKSLEEGNEFKWIP